MKKTKFPGIEAKTYKSNFIKMIKEQCTEFIDTGDFSDLRKIEIVELGAEQFGVKTPVTKVVLPALQVGFVFDKEGRLIGAFNYKD